MTVVYENTRDKQNHPQSLVAALYEQLISGSNSADAEAFAAPFANEGVVIGFDGSEQVGKHNIESEMRRIFEDHETATYVAKVKRMDLLGPAVIVLHASAGMIIPGESDLEPERNAQQTVVAVEQDGEWRIVLFQNTPARFDGPPELVEQFTQELRKQLNSGR